MAREREARGVGDPDRQTLETYLNHWLAHLESRGDHAVTTLSAYRRHCEVAVHHLGSLPLEKLSPLDLDRLYARLLAEGGPPRKDGRKAKPLSRQTVLHVHRVLHVALKQAYRWKLLANNPAADVSPPRQTFRQVRGFTADEVSKLLVAAAADPVTYTMVALLLTTGMRRSEILGLTLDAVDLDAGTVSVERVVLEARGWSDCIVRERPKTASSRRTISIPANVVALLREQRQRVLEDVLAWGKEYAEGPRFLFPRIAGGPMPPMQMTVRLRQICRRAGVEGPQPVHGWRHASASLLVANGGSVKVAQQRLGHSTPAITLKLYVDAQEEQDREAGETLGALLPSAKAG